MRVLIAVIAISVLSGCSKTVDVPESKYGLVFYLGKIEKVVEGPAQADITILLGAVQYINKKEVISLANGMYVIHYEVTNPKEYYIKTIGNGASYIEQKVKDVITEKSLNGEAVSNINQLIEIIEDMKLPIKVVKNA